MTRKQKNEADKLSRRPDSSPALIILYMMGLFGMLSVLYDNALADSKPIVLMITVAIEVFTILLWYIYIHKNKYFMYLVLGICVLIKIYNKIPKNKTILNKELLAQISITVE